MTVRLNETAFETLTKTQMIGIFRENGLRRDWCPVNKPEMVSIARSLGVTRVVDGARRSGMADDLIDSLVADGEPMPDHDEPAAPAAPEVNEVATMLARLLASGKGSVDEDAVRAIAGRMIDSNTKDVLDTVSGWVEQAKSVMIDHAEQLISAMPAREVVVKTERAEVKLDGIVHPVFDKVVRLAAAGLNVMLVGPAGCGKTHLAHQVATALGHSFASISGSAGVSEAQLTGRLLPTGDGGKFNYVESPFVREYQKDSGAFLFDEMDAFDSNCLLAVNQALANGGFEIEARAASGLTTYVKRGSKAILMGSCNTFGTGADMVYVGRSPLDGASLDRWYVVKMDYNPVLEAQLSGLPAPKVAAWQAADEPTEAEIGVVAQWVLDLRTKVAASKLRRIVSTRTLQKAVTARRAGVPFAEIKADLTAGWTRDELAKVGL